MKLSALMVKSILSCRRFKEKKEVVEPEADPERDQRTVFAYQVYRITSILIFIFNMMHNFDNCCVSHIQSNLAFISFICQMPLKVTERDIYEFFSKAGKVSET